jgi:hypothetical protein
VRASDTALPRAPSPKSQANVSGEFDGLDDDAASNRTGTPTGTLAGRLKIAMGVADGGVEGALPPPAQAVSAKAPTHVSHEAARALNRKMDVILLTSFETIGSWRRSPVSTKYRQTLHRIPDLAPLVRRRRAMDASKLRRAASPLDASGSISRR